VGNPTVLRPEGGDDFLGKLLEKKTLSLRCLLLGSQRQARGGTWLSAEGARTGSGAWLGVCGRVLPPGPPDPAAGRLSWCLLLCHRARINVGLAVPRWWPRVQLLRLLQRSDSPTLFSCDVVVLPGPGWQGFCVRGAKKEVGNVLFVARTSS